MTGATKAKKPAAVTPEADAERLVLAQLYRSRSFRGRLSGIIPADILDPTRRRIFDALLELYEAGQSAATPGKIVKLLSGRAEPEAVYAELGELQKLSHVPADQAVAEILAAKMRRIDKQLRDDLGRALDDPLNATPAETALADWRAARAGLSGPREPLSVRVGSIDTFARLIDPRLRQTATPTGCSVIDDLMDGLMRGTVTTVAARPGNGKTSLLLDLVRAFTKPRAIDDKTLPPARSLVFSLEMPAAEMVDRLTLADAGLPITALFGRGLYRQRELDAYQEQRNAHPDRPAFVCDGVLSIEEMRSRVEAFQEAGGLDLVVLDYLTLLRPHQGFDVRENVVRHTRELKAMALELGVAVVVAAQLARGVDRKGEGADDDEDPAGAWTKERRATMGDLHESASIEHDSDALIFLRPLGPKQVAEPGHLPAGFLSPECDLFRRVAWRPFEAYCAKNRRGPTGVQRYAFLDSHGRFLRERP